MLRSKLDNRGMPFWDPAVGLVGQCETPLQAQANFTSIQKNNAIPYFYYGICYLLDTLLETPLAACESITRTGVIQTPFCGESARVTKHPDAPSKRNIRISLSAGPCCLQTCLLDALSELSAAKMRPLASLKCSAAKDLKEPLVFLSKPMMQPTVKSS